MKKFILFSLVVVTATCLLLLSSCCTPNALIGSQAIPLRAQETNMWCWAASGEMAMDFLGTNVTQCDQANKRFGRNDCCNSTVPTACINGGWPEFDKYNFTFSRTSNAALSWSALKKQIYCLRKPVPYSWHWNSGGGHMMVVTGYAELNGTRYVSVNNPLPVDVGAQYFLTYDAYVSGPGYTHWDDFYNITKKP